MARSKISIQLDELRATKEEKDAGRSGCKLVFLISDMPAKEAAPIMNKSTGSMVALTAFR